jgi:DtxR family Mn-dependent transcriptional regulator
MDESLEHEIDEHLEAVWLAREKGSEGDVAEIVRLTPGGGRREMLETMEERGLVRLHGERLELNPEGRVRAETLVRRHRLAERLLADVLGVVGRDMDAAACKFEHFLSPEVSDSICTLLGHPPTCPHGNAIPPGPCCSRQTTEVKPLFVRLDHLAAGETGTVSLISSRSPERLRRLGTLGLMPGAAVRLRQKRPAFVLEVGETTLALEKELAEEIFLKRVC